MILLLDGVVAAAGWYETQEKHPWVGRTGQARNRSNCFVSGILFGTV
jgi:hypothetical protein